MLVIIQNTFREAISKKLLLIFFIINTIVLLVFLLVMASFSLDSLIPGYANFPNKDELVKQFLKQVQVSIIIPLYAGGLFISIFSASGFIPSMLEKGNIDLLLSKPISRDMILISKFTGIILVIFVNIFYLVFCIWLILNIKFGVWEYHFLITIPSITFVFAVFLSLIILVGIFSQNSVLAMIIAYLVYFLLSPILASKDMITTNIITSETGKYIINALYYIIPQTSEIGTITLQLAASGKDINYMPMLTSGIWGITVFIFSIFLFRKKEF